MLPRVERLNRESDIRRVFASGSTRKSPLLTFRYAPSTNDKTRMTVITVRRIGKAHVRNRIRRRIREAYRGLRSRVSPGYDLILIAREPIVVATFSEIEQTIDSLLKRARLYRNTPAV